MKQELWYSTLLIIFKTRQKVKIKIKMQKIISNLINNTKIFIKNKTNNINNNKMKIRKMNYKQKKISIMGIFIKFKIQKFSMENKIDSKFKIVWQIFKILNQAQTKMNNKMNIMVL